MRIKIDIKIKATLWLKGGIEKKITKRSRKKIRNQNNKNHTRKNNTITLNLIIKLKTNKIFTKKSWKKIKIKRIKTKLEDIIFGELRLKNEIKNKKKNLYKKTNIKY